MLDLARQRRVILQGHDFLAEKRKGGTDCKPFFCDAIKWLVRNIYKQLENTLAREV